MQDDVTNEEAIAVSRTLLLRSLPQPNPSELITPSGLERLAQAGIEHYAEMVKDRGVGYARGGRMALADPVLMDPVLTALGLMPEQGLALTLVHTSFGQTTVLTTEGDEIFIDPIVGEVTIIEGEREDSLWFEVNLASLIDGRADEAKDALPSDTGGDLHIEAARQHGEPRAGQCFKLPINHDAPQRFSNMATEITDLVPYLLQIKAERGYEIIRIDPSSLPASEEDEY